MRAAASQTPFAIQHPTPHIPAVRPGASTARPGPDGAHTQVQAPRASKSASSRRVGGAARCEAQWAAPPRLSPARDVVGGAARCEQPRGARERVSIDVHGSVAAQGASLTRSKGRAGNRPRLATGWPSGANRRGAAASCCFGRNPDAARTAPRVPATRVSDRQQQQSDSFCSRLAGCSQKQHRGAAAPAWPKPGVQTRACPCSAGTRQAPGCPCR